MPAQKTIKEQGKTKVRRAGRSKRLPSEIPIELYEHSGQVRPNNPPVGLVDSKTDPDHEPKTYQFDSHLDPFLAWSGKAERDILEVPTVSLHVHERVDTRTIIESVRKTNAVDYEQMALFTKHDKNVALSEEIEFYQHSKNWSNRLIAGDSLLVMNSLLEKEGMEGRVQVVYVDPPYGIKYSSNFQPFTSKRDVKETDSDLNSEPEMLKAFRDTWELGIHSYLSYLRDRLHLAQRLLHHSGSVFVQISAENLHLVRNLLDETFGPQNFVSLITYATTSGFNSGTLARSGDYIIWYAKEKERMKYRQLYTEKNTSMETSTYRWLRMPDGTSRGVTTAEASGRDPIPKGARIYKADNFVSQGETKSPQKFLHDEKTYTPGKGKHWKTSLEGMKRLGELGRIHIAKNSLAYVRYADDFPLRPINNFWSDTATGNFTDTKIYVVQTGSKVVERCILMATDPGDLVLDPTCGSGTAAVAAEKWGRRWLTCDTSRVAITLAKQRLMTATFDYYELVSADEGISSGLKYSRSQRITMGALANNEPAESVFLYDQPIVNKNRVRVAGPFTVEAVPSPTVSPTASTPNHSQKSVGVNSARSGETARQNDWVAELGTTGIRGKGGQNLSFARLGQLSGTRWLHADGEVKNLSHDRIVVSFGPSQAPLDSRQVGLALDEAQTLVPKPAIVAFASFQFDPEAAKDIDAINWPGVQLLKIQMNPDLCTYDLKKKRSSNESFWLVGQPDILVEQIAVGEYKGMYKVAVRGFDYFDTITGQVNSGDSSKIAMWSLDTDYDGRSLFSRQVFFPMGGGANWDKLAKTLKSEIDEELIESYRGTVSLPFELGEHRRVAVKIIDDRGIESFAVFTIDGGI